jgi:osmoprotectant transport system permease protein
MSAIDQMIVYLNDPLNWTIPGGIVDRLVEHLQISAGAVALGCLVGWPVGVLLGRLGIGGGLVVLMSNLSLAVPVLALLTLLPLTFLGFGKPAVIVALAVFAMPPLLATAFTGMREVDPEVRDAARGMGLSFRQRLWRVDLPLAVPYLASGLRTAVVQVIATAALATLVNGGGLGTIINAGFGLDLSVGGGQILAGGLLVAGLALLADGIFAVVQRLVTPAPLRLAGRS